MTKVHRIPRRKTLPTGNMCLRTVGSLGCLGLVASCSPAAPSEESLQSSIVLTLQAPQTDFGSHRTYHLRPEIRQLDGSATLDSSIAGPLLDETREQMNARGYESLDAATGADLAVEMVYVSSQWVSTYCYSWWDPYYWGYAGSYYYPYYDCSGASWQTNTLAIMMTDLGSPRGARDRPVASGRSAQVLSGIWFAGISGLVISASDSLKKGVDGIDQAFAQSPYLARR